MEDSGEKDCVAHPGAGHGAAGSGFCRSQGPDHQEGCSGHQGDKPAMLARVTSTPVLLHSPQSWGMGTVQEYAVFQAASYTLTLYPSKQDMEQKLSLVFMVRKLSSEVKLLVSSHSAVLGMDTWSLNLGAGLLLESEDHGGTNCVF